MNIKCFAHGRMTRDIDQITTSGGTTITKGGLASDFGYGDNKGTVFIDWVSFGKTGDVIAKFHKKGSEIILEGELQLDEWTDKNGDQVKKMKIKVDGFQFCGSKSDVKPTADDEEPTAELPF